MKNIAVRLLTGAAVLFMNPMGFGQVVVPPIPGSQSCSGGNGALSSNTTIASGQTYWYTGSGNVANITINPGGTLVVCGDLTIPNATLNGGLILIEAGGTLSLGNPTSASSAQIVNRGTLNLNRAAGFTINSSTFYVDDNGTLNTAGNLTLNTVTSFGDNSQIAINGNLIVNSGGLALGDDVTMDVSGSFTLNANVDLGERNNVTTGGGLTLNSGNFNVGDSTDLVINGSVTTINANIYLGDYTTMTLTGDLVFNSGTFELNNFSTFMVQGDATVNDEFTYGGLPGNGAFIEIQGNSTFNAPASFSQWINVCSSNPLTPGELGNATPSCVNPLPIELLYFHAARLNQTFHFEWKTAAEVNNAWYFIEISEDLVLWEQIAALPGGGTLPTGATYQSQVPANQNAGYARLIQQDYDGKQEIFQPVAIKFQDAESAQLDMSLMSGGVQLSALAYPVHIQIFGAQGNLLTQTSFSEVSLFPLPSGLSLWELCTADGTCLQKKFFRQP